MQSRFKIDIKRTVRNGAFLIPYEAIAKEILGPGYDLSLVICADTLSRGINIKYRKKDYAPNVLSFPYSAHEGEIFLNVRKAEREAKSAGISSKARLALLFVHGCFHLNGHDHGAKMEALEQKILTKFKLAS